MCEIHSHTSLQCATNHIQKFRRLSVKCLYHLFFESCTPCSSRYPSNQNNHQKACACQKSFELGFSPQESLEYVISSSMGCQVNIATSTVARNISLSEGNQLNYSFFMLRWLSERYQRLFLCVQVYTSVRSKNELSYIMSKLMNGTVIQVFVSKKHDGTLEVFIVYKNIYISYFVICLFEYMLSMF